MEKEKKEEQEKSRDTLCPLPTTPDRDCLCNLIDCAFVHYRTGDKAGECSIKSGMLVLEKLTKIMEMVQPVMSGNSLLSKGAHDTLIPFALDLCESDMEAIEQTKCKSYHLLTTHAGRLFANLQIAKIVIGQDGYGNVANKERYRTVRAAFLALQERYGLAYDNYRI